MALTDTEIIGADTQKSRTPSACGSHPTIGKNPNASIGRMIERTIRPSLRWHYPDQVNRSAAEFSALSAWLTPSSRFYPYVVAIINVA